MVDFGKTIFGQSSTVENKKDTKVAVRIALRNAPEIHALILSVCENIESRLCHEVSIDSTRNKDENKIQDNPQSKLNDDIERIHKNLEKYVRELDMSAFPGHEAVDVTRHLCKRSIHICISLTHNKRCRQKIDHLLKEVKSCSDEAEI